VRPLSFLPFADAGLRFIKGNEHGGERPGPFRHEQIPVSLLAVGGNLHINALLRVAVLVRRLKTLHGGLLQKWRPRAQSFMPRFENLRAALRPGFFGFHARAIGEEER
jgi:hypothetical protein